MFSLFLLEKIAFYYLSQVITPFASRADLQPMIHLLTIHQVPKQRINQMIQSIVQDLKKRLNPKKISGQRTFIQEHLCMVCDHYYPTEVMDWRVILNPTHMDYRIQLRFCRNPECQEIAQYSYLHSVFEDNILLEDIPPHHNTFWNPFPKENESLFLQTINYYDEETQQTIKNIMLYEVPCYRSFIDVPEPHIYFQSYYSFQGQTNMRMINLQKLITDNPKFLKHLQENPEALDFHPHLFEEEDQEIQAYLQNIRNHFQLPQSPLHKHQDSLRKVDS